MHATQRENILIEIGTKVPLYIPRATASVAALQRKNVETGECHFAIRGCERNLNDWIGTNFGDIEAAMHQGVATFGV